MAAHNDRPPSIWDFTKHVPPGWRPGLSWYPYKTYKQRLKLWKVITSAAQNEIGPLVVSRLEGEPFETGIKLEVFRNGQKFVGEEALVLPAILEERDLAGQVIVPAQKAGVTHLFDILDQLHLIHDDDEADAKLDAFFDMRRGSRTLVQYMADFREKFHDAEVGSGLQMNPGTKTHLLFKHSGLHPKRIADIKLQFGGDTKRYEEIYSMLLRIAKNEVAEGSNNFFADDDLIHNLYGTDDAEDVDDEDDFWCYNAAEEAWFVYDWEHQWCRTECYYDRGGNWHDDGTTAYYAGMEDDDDYDDDEQVLWNSKPSGVGPTGKGKNRFGGKGKFRRRRKGRGGFSFRPKGKSKGKGKFRGKQFFDDSRPDSELFGKKGGSGKWKPNSSTYGPSAGASHQKECGICGSKWHGAEDCPVEKTKRQQLAMTPPSSAGTRSRGHGLLSSTDSPVHPGMGSSSPPVSPRSTASSWIVHGPESQHALSDSQPTLSPSTQAVMDPWGPLGNGPNRDINAEVERQIARARRLFLTSVFTTETPDQCFTGYHEVRGRRRYGLIVDPGASKGLMGTETLREYVTAVLKPHQLASSIVVQESSTTFSGINGEVDPSAGAAELPMLIPELPGSVFCTDLIGGAGSRCPGLLSLMTFMNLYGSLLCNIFENGDGVVIFCETDSTGKFTNVVFIRVLPTNSGHYLLPTDRSYSQQQLVSEQRLLRKKVNDYMTAVMKLTAWCKPLEHQSLHTDSETRENGRQCGDITLSPTSLQSDSSTKTSLTHPIPRPPPGLTKSPVTALAATTCSTILSFYRAWSKLPGQRWTGEELLPPHLSKDKASQLHRDYKAMPEEFYTRTELPVITPENIDDYVDLLKRSPRANFQERCSGSSRLSLFALLIGMMCLFPVDYRYGWDMSKLEHQNKLNELREIGIDVTYWAPTCRPWSKSSIRQNPQTRELARQQERPFLGWMSQDCQRARQLGDDALLENPGDSELFREPTIAELEDIGMKKRITDQCRHGACIETGELVRKRTRFNSSAALRHTCRMCQCTAPHAHLQGTYGGINRTAMAAVAPASMCKSLCRDFMRRIINLGKATASTFQAIKPTSFRAYWACPRCKHGNKTDVDHTRIKGNCKLAGPRRDSVDAPSAAPAGSTTSPGTLARSSAPPVTPARSTSPPGALARSSPPLAAPARSTSSTTSKDIGVTPVALKDDPCPGFSLKDIKKKILASTDEKEMLKLLLGIHIKFWHAPVMDLIKFLQAGQCFTPLAKKVVKLVCRNCKRCRDVSRPARKPIIKIGLAVRHNHRVQIDLFQSWQSWFILLIDEFSRFKVAAHIQDRQASHLLYTVFDKWIRFFGPMTDLLTDQEGASVSELCGRLCDRFSINRVLAGTDDHTLTGLVERYIQLVRLASLKTWKDVQSAGLDVSKEYVVEEAAMATNLVMTHGGQSPCCIVMGYEPRDFYDFESSTLDSVTAALETSPDPFETGLRCRQLSKQNVLKSVVEERLSRATNTAVQQSELVDPHDLDGVKEVDIYRVPERKDQDGWRGPAELVRVSIVDGAGTGIVVWQSVPYILPLRHIRRHLAQALWMIFVGGITTVENSDQLLTKLFDYVESLLPGTRVMLGLMIKESGEEVLLPSAEELLTHAIFDICRKVAKQTFELAAFDGVLLGSALRHIGVLNGIHWGLLIIWNKYSRGTYEIFEVNPSKGTHLQGRTSSAWEKTSFIMYYKRLGDATLGDDGPDLLQAWDDITEIMHQPDDFDDGNSILDLFQPPTDPQPPELSDSSIRDNIEADISDSPPQPPAPPAPPAITTTAPAESQQSSLSELSDSSMLDNVEADISASPPQPPVPPAPPKITTTTPPAPLPITEWIQQQQQTRQQSDPKPENITEDRDKSRSPRPADEKSETATVPPKTQPQPSTPRDRQRPRSSSRSPKPKPDRGDVPPETQPQPSSPRDEQRPRSSSRSPRPKPDRGDVPLKGPVRFDIAQDDSPPQNMEDAPPGDLNDTMEYAPDGTAPPQLPLVEPTQSSSSSGSQHKTRVRDMVEAIEGDLDRSRTRIYEEPPLTADTPTDSASAAAPPPNTLAPTPSTTDTAPLLPVIGEQVEEQQEAQEDTVDYAPATKDDKDLDDHQSLYVRDRLSKAFMSSEYDDLAKSSRHSRQCKSVLHLHDGNKTELNYHYTPMTDEERVAAQLQQESSPHDALNYLQQPHMEDDGTGSQLSQLLHAWHRGQEPYTKTEATMCIPGPWKQNRCFLYSLIDGTAEVYAGQTDNVLSEQDIYEHWDLVEEADAAEIQAFVDFDVFRLGSVKGLRQASTSGKLNTIDGIWVRRWKQINEDGRVRWIVKSRLCGRGYLDKQKFEIHRHSSTASRVSQRLAVSLCVTERLVMESWDISNAFLQGMSFDELRRRAKELRIELHTVRNVFLKPPANVWRHLNGAKNSKFNINLFEVHLYLLILVKPMYGLIDAPLLWGIGLSTYVRQELQGTVSYFDDNFYVWIERGHVVLLFTIHVDDILAIGKQDMLDWARELLETRFGKVKRQKLPFTHTGILHSRLEDGGISLKQNDSLKSMKLIPIPTGEDTMAADSQSAHLFRSLLASLLYITQCHLELATGVSVLQSFNNSPTIGHLKQANALLRKGLKEGDAIGLFYRPITPPFVILDIDDASHGSRSTSYAQEGGIQGLTTDFGFGEYNGEIHHTTMASLSRPLHVIIASTCKSGRISHSTSHGETLAGVRGIQTAQLVALRLTEVYYSTLYQQPRSHHVFLELERLGAYIVPVDHVTDCYDFLELVTGLRGVPADKSQRLAVLSAREERITGRVRHFFHWPTDIMIADALTKVGVFPQMYMLLTSGILNLRSGSGKPSTCRTLRGTLDYSEDDLITLQG